MSKFQESLGSGKKYDSHKKKKACKEVLIVPRSEYI